MDGFDRDPEQWGVATEFIDRRRFDGLCRGGLTARQASELAARLIGLPMPKRGTWTYTELQRIVFLRWLVETGRLGS